MEIKSNLFSRESRIGQFHDSFEPIGNSRMSAKGFVAIAQFFLGKFGAFFYSKKLGNMILDQFDDLVFFRMVKPPLAIA